MSRNRTRNKRRKASELRLQQVSLLWPLQRGLCFYCLKPLPLLSATVDHVIPKSRGGGDGVDNKVLACAECNEEKADDIVPDYLIQSRICFFNGDGGF